MTVCPEFALQHSLRGHR